MGMGCGGGVGTVLSTLLPGKQVSVCVLHGEAVARGHTGSWEQSR